MGTVWIAADVTGRCARALLHSWGDRQEVRQRAAQAALNLVRKAWRRLGVVSGRRYRVQTKIAAHEVPTASTGKR